MKNLRIYGNKPFKVAVIHGGPGAPGAMAPVARELAANQGILEPLQTAASLDGQVLELRTVLEENADLPVTLIGSSWGAWLSFVFSARYPESTRKIILVGSGPFEEKYAVNIMETRLNRLNEEESKELHSLMAIFNNPTAADKNTLLSRLGKLCTKADTYNPLTLDTEVLECQYDIHINVWNDASTLRSTGKLLELGKQIQCPVTALHGDYDPHPFEGVRVPLSSLFKDFKFYLLKSCGHYPWLEREAKELFFEILKEEL
ncbi:MAG: alpha/beta hydrolase [bacterium]|nr:alpha/beta hydrolase [bacterium]